MFSVVSMARMNEFRCPSCMYVVSYLNKFSSPLLLSFDLSVCPPISLPVYVRSEKLILHKFNAFTIAYCRILSSTLLSKRFTKWHTPHIH